jgi:hypothetical protein
MVSMLINVRWRGELRWGQTRGGTSLGSDPGFGIARASIALRTSLGSDSGFGIRDCEGVG